MAFVIPSERAEDCLEHKETGFSGQFLREVWFEEVRERLPRHL